jgi:kynurenine formamidase
MTGLAVPDARPYPWPYDGSVPPGRLALVVAGWDAHWGTTDDGGAGGSAGELAELAALVAEAGGSVLTVSHRAAAPLPPLHPAAWHVAAAGIDGFYGSPLDAVLRTQGLTHLAVAGFGLEAPVHSTMRSANDRGYECLLLTDLSVPTDPDLARAAVHTVTMSGGIFGAVAPSAVLASQLAHRSAHLTGGPS